MGLSAETSAQDPDNSVCNGYSLNKTEGYWKIMFFYRRRVSGSESGTLEKHTG